MRVVVQRVSRAQVRVKGEAVATVGPGFLILAGFTHQDSERDVVWMARKLAGLRILEDRSGSMNLSVKDIHGEALVVSQFTLYADVRKGRRPAFVAAAEPKRAELLYDQFCELLAEEGVPVKKGVFGAKMEVELVNEGPVTIIIETPSLQGEDTKIK